MAVSLLRGHVAGLDIHTATVQLHQRAKPLDVCLLVANHSFNYRRLLSTEQVLFESEMLLLLPKLWATQLQHGEICRCLVGNDRPECACKPVDASVLRMAASVTSVHRCEQSASD